MAILFSVLYHTVGPENSFHSLSGGVPWPLYFLFPLGEIFVQWKGCTLTGLGLGHASV